LCIHSDELSANPKRLPGLSGAGSIIATRLLPGGEDELEQNLLNWWDAGRTPSLWRWKSLKN
jgi:hypothetical protein